MKTTQSSFRTNFSIQNKKNLLFIQRDLHLKCSPINIRKKITQKEREISKEIEEFSFLQKEIENERNSPLSSELSDMYFY